MEKEFIPYEPALALKELGFDKPCLKFYANKKLVLALDTDNGDINSKLNQYNPLYVSAPTFSQAFRFFREKYGLHPHFCFFTDEKLWNVDIYAYLKEYGLKTDPCTMKFKAYEEAESACLIKLIEIVKKK